MVEERAVSCVGPGLDAEQAATPPASVDTPDTKEMGRGAESEDSAAQQLSSRQPDASLPSSLSSPSASISSLAASLTESSLAHFPVRERFVAIPVDEAPVLPVGWVKVDFHMHTYGSGDAVTTDDEFGAAVEEADLDVVCITDHNAVRVAHILAAELDVRVIIGEEIKTHEGELIGLFLQERVAFGYPSAVAASMVREQGGLTYVPHPIGPRNYAMSTEAMFALIEEDLLDAIEVFNARNSLDVINRKAAAFATATGLPGGAGSDAHYPEEIGAAWLIMPDFDSPDDFLESMQEGQVVGTRHDPKMSVWRPRIIPSSSALFS